MEGRKLINKIKTMRRRSGGGGGGQRSTLKERKWQEQSRERHTQRENTCSAIGKRHLNSTRLRMSLTSLP